MTASCPSSAMITRPLTTRHTTSARVRAVIAKHPGVTLREIREHIGIDAMPGVRRRDPDAELLRRHWAVKASAAYEVRRGRVVRVDGRYWPA